ncbi:PREDICTED: uncharacterized protein LOC105449465 [Wasmannia auropunctata]|uniref:uncharacterized protein LOC105449465 n=1 Tax=Wasmannia auropunctata TaxID=64793 RepID=UPI0005EFD372|nr:PREDICTED: uncharacterized protein LOC105449465 [Wasmannia auropunctata]
MTLYKLQIGLFTENLDTILQAERQNNVRQRRSRHTNSLSQTEEEHTFRRNTGQNSSQTHRAAVTHTIVQRAQLIEESQAIDIASNSETEFTDLQERQNTVRRRESRHEHTTHLEQRKSSTYPEYLQTKIIILI